MASTNFAVKSAHNPYRKLAISVKQLTLNTKNVLTTPNPLAMIIESPTQLAEKICNASEIFFARTNRELRITEANNLFWSVFGSDHTFNTGTFLYNITQFSQLENFQGLCYECLSQPGITKNFQLQLANGQQPQQCLCFEIESIVEDHRITGLNLFGRDFTEQKNKEAELLYQVRLLDQVSEAVITTDILFNILSWNKPAENIYHFSKEEIIGRNAFNIFNYNYTTGSREEAANQLMEYDSWQGEVDFIRHDDAAHIFLHASVTTIRDQQNAILGYVAVNRDITAAKNSSHNRFSKAEQILDAYAQTSNEGLFIIDEAYKLVYVNKAAAGIAQLAISGPIEPGDDLMELSHPKRKQIMQQALQKVFSGETIRYEAMYDFFTDQQVHWFSHMITPISNEEGKVLYACAVSTDITKEKQLQQELLLREQQKRKELLTEIIAAQEKERHRIAFELHENIAQLLAMSKLYMQSAEATKNNLTAGLIVSTAINELRKISYALDPENLKALGLVETVRLLVANLNKTQNIKIKFFTENYTAYYPCDHEIELAIFRIIQTKLDNIIRYSNATTTEITLSKSKTEVLLSISDNGIGFNLNAKEQGFGIKNMYNRSELYGGSLLINTEPGKGCILTLFMPTHHTKNL